MKICTTCGRNLDDDVDVCPDDGTPLFARAAAVATASRSNSSMAARLSSDDDSDNTQVVSKDALDQQLAQMGHRARQPPTPSPSPGLSTSAPPRRREAAPTPDAAISEADVQARLAALKKSEAPPKQAARPITDEPTIQMKSNEQEEFRQLAQQLITQGSDSSLTARPSPKPPTPPPAATPPTPPPATPPTPPPAADSGSIDFLDMDDEDDEPVGSQPLGDVDAPSSGPQRPSLTNVAVSSLIEDTLAEGSGIKAVPRADPIAYVDSGVLTSPEQDAPPDFEIPKAKKPRRREQGTSKVLVGLFLFLLVLAGAVITWYYGLPELGIERPLAIPYLDDYMVP